MVIDGKEVKVFSSSSGVPAPGEWLCSPIAVIPPGHIVSFLMWCLVMASPSSLSDPLLPLFNRERRSRERRRGNGQGLLADPDSVTPDDAFFEHSLSDVQAHHASVLARSKRLNEAPLLTAKHRDEEKASREKRKADKWPTVGDQLTRSPLFSSFATK